MGVSVGKWTKHNLLKKDKILVNYLPETLLFTEESYHNLLDKYGTIIIKPCFGSYGKGVIQVSSRDNGQIEIHSEFDKNIYNDKKEAYVSLVKNYCSPQKKYIVQQKISLASIQNSPFDIRVMVQRRINTSEWQVTGKLAKVAARGYIITNVARTVCPVEEAIAASGLHASPNEILKEIDKVSLLTANHLINYYKESHVFGLDVAIDTEGKIWIIEVNLKPRISMFKLLKDKKQYKMIKRYRRR